MLLNQDELIALTRRDRPKAQARVLRLLGVPFRAHPIDGVLLVSRVAVEQSLGVTVERAIAQEFDVNIEGLRNHGQTSTPH